MKQNKFLFKQNTTKTEYIYIYIPAIEPSLKRDTINQASSVLATKVHTLLPWDVLYFV